MLALRLAPRPLDRIVPVAAFTWLGLAFLLFVAVLAFDLARLAAEGASLALAHLRSLPEPPADPARRVFVARSLAGAAVAAAAGTSAIAFRSATGPAQVSEVPVTLERLPRTLSGFTIAQVSDLHVGPTIGERHVRRIVDQVNALRPDLVAITGDLVDGTVAELGDAVAHLSRLSAPHGVFFVTGNHEYYSGVGPWLAELRRLGVRVLRNERVVVGDAGASFDLAGVDDWSARGYGGGHGLDLPAALAGRGPVRRGAPALGAYPRRADRALERRGRRGVPVREGALPPRRGWARRTGLRLARRRVLGAPDAARRPARDREARPRRHVAPAGAPAAGRCAPSRWSSARRSARLRDGGNHVRSQNPRSSRTAPRARRGGRARVRPGARGVAREAGEPDRLLAERGLRPLPRSSLRAAPPLAPRDVVHEPALPGAVLRAAPAGGEPRRRARGRGPDLHRVPCSGRVRVRAGSRDERGGFRPEPHRRHLRPLPHDQRVRRAGAAERQLHLDPLGREARAAPAAHRLAPGTLAPPREERGLRRLSRGGEPARTTREGDLHGVEEEPIRPGRVAVPGLPHEQGRAPRGGRAIRVRDRGAARLRRPPHGAAAPLAPVPGGALGGSDGRGRDGERRDAGPPRARRRAGTGPGPRRQPQDRTPVPDGQRRAAAPVARGGRDRGREDGPGARDLAGDGRLRSGGRRRGRRALAGHGRARRLEDVPGGADRRAPPADALPLGGGVDRLGQPAPSRRDPRGGLHGDVPARHRPGTARCAARVRRVPDGARRRAPGPAGEAGPGFVGLGRARAPPRGACTPGGGGHPRAPRDAAAAPREEDGGAKAERALARILRLGAERPDDVRQPLAGASAREEPVRQLRRQSRERVRLGVHVHHRGPAAPGELADLHGQVRRPARAHDEQEVRPPRRPEGAVEVVVLLVVVLVEEQHVRPEPAATARAGERGAFARAERLHAPRHERRQVHPSEPALPGAADPGRVAVDAEDAAGSGPAVQPVDVLGDEGEAVAEGVLERDQRRVPRVGPRGEHAAEAVQVPPPDLLGRALEHLPGGHLLGHVVPRADDPDPLVAAEGRDPALGADAGAGERHHPSLPLTHRAEDPLELRVHRAARHFFESSSRNSSSLTIRLRMRSRIIAAIACAGFTTSGCAGAPLASLSSESRIASSCSVRSREGRRPSTISSSWSCESSIGSPGSKIGASPVFSSSSSAYAAAGAGGGWAASSVAASPCAPKKASSASFEPPPNGSNSASPSTPESASRSSAIASTAAAPG